MRKPGRSSDPHVVSRCTEVASPYRSIACRAIRRVAAASLVGLALAGILPSCDALRYFGPEASEWDAMEARLADLRDAPERRFVVYPVRRHDGVDAAGAEELAALIEESGVGSAQPLEQGPWFEVRRSVNEQSLLWEVARKFRAYAREHPPGDGYALYADYYLDEEAGRVGAVHFVVCDGTGEWVLVDFQNSHHDDFQETKPTSRRDCARLVAFRLARALR